MKKIWLYAMDPDPGTEGFGLFGIKWETGREIEGYSITEGHSVNIPESHWPSFLALLEPLGDTVTYANRSTRADVDVT